MVFIIKKRYLRVIPIYLVQDEGFNFVFNEIRGHKPQKTYKEYKNLRLLISFKASRELKFCKRL